jgi:hypothetical protein
MEPIVQTNMERVESVILVLRGRKVIIDADLARLYGVPTKVLNQAVSRNRDRFPQDFLFQLTPEEKEEVVTNCDHLGKIKFSKVLPNAFTEFGAIMAANVLNSEQAVRASVFVVRAFLRMREMLHAGTEFGLKLSEIERRLDGHDDVLRDVISEIRELTHAEPRTARRIGFNADDGST